jgi:arachidonate 15-lipoxygenase
MLVHLARTHLVSEAFCVATQRHLASTHPLNLLLMPHFEGDVFINELAALVIMGSEHFGDIILAAPIGAITTTAANARLDWDFYARMPPVDFANRGVADATALPEYPFRDDALLVWDAILAWTTDYVSVYYASDHDVTADTELAAWSTELSAVGKVKGFRPILDRAQLAEVLAMIVFTASAQHAAVNYPQKQLMTYAPFYAGVMAAPGPDAIVGATEQDWLDLLPGVFGSLVQLYFLSVLGSVYYRRLGEYRTNTFPYPSTLTDPRVVAANGPLQRFQAALERVEQVIGTRNAERTHPYEFLLPSKIPASTNI